MNPLRGIALKLASVVVFTIMAALIKATADVVPPGEQVFFRSFFAIPVILIWLARRGELSIGLRTANPMSHVYRGIIGTAAMGFGFAGLGLLPLPEVTAVGYAAPLLTVIFAAMFLNEQVGWVRLTAVGLGLIGVLVVLSPSLRAVQAGLSSDQMLGAIVTLIGAVFAALAQIFIRILVQQERTSTIVFWFSVTATMLSLVTLPFGWVIPSGMDAALLVASGLLGGLGQILLTSAYRYADASLVAPFDYSSILFAIVLGLVFFGERPVATVLWGAGIVIAAGVMIIWREGQLGLKRNRPRAAGTPQG